MSNGAAPTYLENHTMRLSDLEWIFMLRSPQAVGESDSPVVEVAPLIFLADTSPDTKERGCFEPGFPAKNL